MSKRNSPQNKATRRAQKQRVTPASLVTHEPAMPVNWPHSHVSVELTDSSIDECLVITIHGVKHYLHATTARELEKMLTGKLVEYNQRCAKYGIPGV